MREAKSEDILLLTLLGLIWGSSFFNIKIATYSYEPFTLALIRVIFASLPLLILCRFKKIKIQAFSKNWKPYALIGLCNIAIPFTLIAIGTAKINSYLAAMLMSTTPLSGSILAHFFTKDEKITFVKSIGILIGFLGIVFLFLDKVIINEIYYRLTNWEKFGRYLFIGRVNNVIVMKISSDENIIKNKNVYLRIELKWDWDYAKQNNLEEIAYKYGYIDEKKIGKSFKTLQIILQKQWGLNPNGLLV